MSGIRSSGLSRATVQAMIDASGGGVSVPTAGVTPTSLLALAPNLGPVGSVWFAPGSTVVQYVGAIYGGGCTFPSPAAAPDAYGVAHTSNATDVHSCGLSGHGGVCPTTRRERRPWFWGRAKLGSVVTTCGWWAGLFKSGLIDHTTYPDYCLAFTCSSSASETTWQLGSRDGTTTSKTDTLVPVTADHEYSWYYQIEGASCDNVRWAIYDHTAALFYSGLIAGKANLPALTDNLGPIIHGVNVGAISHTIYLPPTPFLLGQL